MNKYTNPNSLSEVYYIICQTWWRQRYCRTGSLVIINIVTADRSECVSAQIQTNAAKLSEQSFTVKMNNDPKRNKANGQVSHLIAAFFSVTEHKLTAERPTNKKQLNTTAVKIKR